MPALGDLVHETTTGTGTGNLDLVNVNGKRSFNTAFGNGAPTNVFDYFISNRGAAEWERGTGHMSDSDTLVRDTVLASSNAGAAVNFSAGTKDVTNDEPAGNQGFRGQRPGTATNDDAAAGNIGEALSGQLLQASAISLTNNVAANVISVSLTAGDWDVWGIVHFAQEATTVLTGINCGITTTSATLPGADDGRAGLNVAFTGNSTPSLEAPIRRHSLSATTTVYLVGRAAFTTAGLTAFGLIRARRVR